MDWLVPSDWSTIFLPDQPLLEIFARGSIMYFAIFVLLRLIKRQAGEVSTTDLLVLVLIADAAQNAMAGGYHSLADGIFLVAVLIGWNFALEWLGFHFPRFEKILRSPPIILIKNGRIIHQNLKKELITLEDLMSRLRKEGLEKISQVKIACMESEGKISVIKRKRES